MQQAMRRATHLCDRCREPYSTERETRCPHCGLESTGRDRLLVGSVLGDRILAITLIVAPMVQKLLVPELSLLLSFAVLGLQLTFWIVFFTLLRPFAVFRRTYAAIVGVMGVLCVLATVAGGLLSWFKERDLGALIEMLVLAALILAFTGVTVWVVFRKPRS